MFIKWKYNDHGAGGFRELEVPTETHTSGNTYYDGERSVEDYICEQGLVPTWSERFTKSRIEWEKLENPSKEFLQSQIKKLSNEIAIRRKEVKRYKNLLITLDIS